MVASADVTFALRPAQPATWTAEVLKDFPAAAPALSSEPPDRFSRMISTWNCFVFITTMAVRRRKRNERGWWHEATAPIRLCREIPRLALDTSTDESLAFPRPQLRGLSRNLHSRLWHSDETCIFDIWLEAQEVEASFDFLCPGLDICVLPPPALR